MLVKKIETQQKQQLTISLQGKTVDRIGAYMDLYETQYGEQVDRSSLIEEILNQAMSKDRDFKKYEKELQDKQKGAASAEADSPSSTSGSQGI